MASLGNASEPVLDLRAAILAAGATYIAGGLLGFFALAVVDDGSFRAGPIGIVAALSLLVGVSHVARSRHLRSGEFFFWHLFGPLLIAAAVYFAGAVLSAYAAMLWVWAGTLAFFVFDVRRALFVVALIGLSYAAVLAVQEANSYALVRWLITMTTITLTGGIVAWLVRGSALLRARSERAEKEAARVRSELEMERLNRLKSFVSPQVADLLTQDDSSMLKPHRREIAVLFVDLRGFTRFVSSAEPEDVGLVLEDFYRVCIDVAQECGATIGDIAGDGVMAYFNDPVPCDRPAEQALTAATQIRRGLVDRQYEWERLGFELGHGIGIAYGYATIGMLDAVGFSRYGPVGTVVNLAARLCSEAASGQIIVDQRTQATLTDVDLEPLELVDVKGFGSPVRAFRVTVTQEGAEAR